jgi:hypothetical protein
LNHKQALRGILNLKRPLGGAAAIALKAVTAKQEKFVSGASLAKGEGMN